ncbi:hypothetical protein ACHAXT_010308 [Thalassiosira profunda]
MAAAGAADEGAVESGGGNEQHDDDVTADVLRRQRHEAFREVGFSSVAEQKTVSGLATLSFSSFPAAALDTDLDISKSAPSTSNRSDDQTTQQQSQLDGESAPARTMISPEAGLHRDGEQARLVESARRRQRRHRSRNEETTYQWLEESASQFWESILVFGGLIDDPRNDPMHRGRHVTMPPNPYRGNERGTSNRKRRSKPSTETNESDPVVEAPPPPLSYSTTLPDRPRIVRMVYYVAKLLIFTQSTPRKDTDAAAQPTTSTPRIAQPIERLQRKHPNATHAECKRFFDCVKQKEEAASKRIEAFFQWRSDCGLQTDPPPKDAPKPIDRTARVFDEAFEKNDEADWDAASKRAIGIVTKSHVEDKAAKLPQIICSYEEPLEDGQTNGEGENPPPRCRDGTRIFHILPFRLDLSVATAPTYSLAVALYLDRRLSRASAERVTLVVDVRGGRGWANPTPWSTLPFIQSTASLLGSHYPERLERLLLFPLPKSAQWVWSAAQKCLDPNTASKVVVVGSAEGGLPAELTVFVDEASLDVLEKRRRSFFVASS